MQISGTANIHTAQPVNPPHRAAVPTPAPSNDALTMVDQLDISHEADLVSRLGDIPAIRAERVAVIRSQIDAGMYETDEKLDVAVSRLLNELA